MSVSESSVIKNDVIKRFDCNSMPPLVIFSILFVVCCVLLLFVSCFFLNHFFLNIFFRNNIQRNARPDLGPICLQRLSADDTQKAMK